MKVVPLPRPAARRAVGARRLDAFPYLLVAPIALLLTAISFYPALDAVWLAMTDAIAAAARQRAVHRLRQLPAPGRRSDLPAGLWRTLRWDVAVVFIELAIALPIALFLNLKFRGRGIVRAAVMVPYIIPPAVVALMWVYMFDGNFGVVNDLLVRLGVIDRYVSWLSDPDRQLRGHRRRHGLVRPAADGADPSGRAADDPAGALRGRQRRRRQCLAAVPLHHAAASHADRSCSSCCCA